MSVDIVIFFIFLLSHFVIGLGAMSVNVVKHYAIGIKKFSVSTLAIAITTTSYCGGGLLVVSLLLYENKYNLLFEVICIWSLVFCLIVLFIGQVFVPRMGALLGHLSIAESIGHFYGSTLRTITAIYDLCRIVTGTVLKCKFITTLTSLIGLDKHLTIMVVISVLLCSATLGGVLPITLSNTIQFYSIGLFIFVLNILIFMNMHLQYDQNLIDILSNHPYCKSAFKMHIIEENPILIVFTLFYVVFLLLSSLLQHVYKAKDIEQGRRSFTTASCISFVGGFFIILTILVLCSNTSLKLEKLLNYILLNYGLFPGFKGLMWIFLIALLLSSIGSELNTAAVLVTHDIVRSLSQNFKNKIVIVRYVFVLLGILVIILTLYVKHLFISIMLCVSLCCITFVNIPLFMAILGFRFRADAVLYGMIIGMVTTISLGILMQCHYMQICFMGIVFLGVMINVLVLIGSHYFLPKLAMTGWVGIDNRDEFVLDQYKQKKTRYKILNMLIMREFVNYLRKVVLFSDRYFFYLGVYILFAYFVSLFSIKSIGYFPYYMYAMGCSIFLITFPTYYYSSYKKKGGIIIFWSLSIYLFLFLGGSINFIANGYKKLHGVIVVLNIVVGNILLPLYVVGSLVFLGWLVAYLWFGLRIEESFFQLWIFKYPEFTHLLVTGMILLLSMVKWYKEQKSILKKMQFIRNLELENKIYQTSRGLYYQESLDQLVSDSILEEQSDNARLTTLNTESNHELELVHHMDTVSMIPFQKNKFLSYLEDYSYYDKNALPLHVHAITLSSFLESVEDTLHLLHKDIFLLVNVQRQHISIKGDKNQLKYLAVQSSRYLYENNTPKNNIIQINLLPTTLHYELNMPCQGNMQDKVIKKIPAVGIQFVTVKKSSDIALNYSGDLGRAAITTFETKVNIGLRENERIIDAHYGYMEIHENKATYLYVLPKDVTLIRNDVMKGLQVINRHKIYETNATIAQEKELINLIKRKGIFKDVVKDFREDLIVVEIFLFMKKCHGVNTRRYTSEPSYIFSMEMAVILLHIHIHYSLDVLIAALLHDIMEVAPISLCYLRSKYGYNVAFLVGQMVSKIQDIKQETQDIRDQYSHLHDDDPMDLMILKLVKRLVNIRSEAIYETNEKREILIKETLEEYVPLAQRFDIQWIAKELIKRCEALRNNSTLIIV